VNDELGSPLDAVFLADIDDGETEGPADGEDASTDPVHVQRRKRWFPGTCPFHPSHIDPDDSVRH
jgi:hypothetical protein